MKNLIYPWDDSKFNLISPNKEDLNSIYFNLQTHGYHIQKNKPEDNIIKTIDKIVPLLLDDNWVFILCNNSLFMKSLANYIPVVYALSSTYSTISTNTIELCNIFYKNYDEDLENMLHKYKIFTLLYWENILEHPNYIQKYTGMFFDLLNFRINRKCTTVFTCLYSGEAASKNEIKIIYDKIALSLGNGVRTILDSKISIIDIPIKTISTWDKVGRLSL